jgi:hypothetical protein
VDETPHP